MKKYAVGIIMMSLLLLTGCKKDLTKLVEQKETRVKVGSTINLTDLFTCEDNISIGFKNADSFNVNKVGSYSLETTITDGNKETNKTYIIEVYDDEAPVINATDIVIYENQEYDLLGNVIVTDNSNEEIKATISEQNVDNKKAGEYSVKYYANDSSGNKTEKQVKVTVKHKYTYSELKKLAKKIVKEKSLNKLEVKTNSDKDVVWVSAKNSFELIQKNSSFYDILPSWALIIENHEISFSILVDFFLIDKDDYFTPEHAYIKSNKGKIESDDNSYHFDYRDDYLYSYLHISYLQYLFTDKEKVDKSIDIFNGDNVEFNIYADKEKFGYKINKKEKKVIQQLIEFYNTLNSICF